MISLSFPVLVSVWCTSLWLLYVFNFLTTPTCVVLPILPCLELDTKQSADLSPNPSEKTRVTLTKRESKGSQALPVIRSLLSQSENWFEITTPDDYQYPGVFNTSIHKE